MAGTAFKATGRRKEATARVTLLDGNGDYTVNGQPLKQFLNRETLVMVVEQPMKLVEMDGKVDFHCRVSGGGKSGQAGAIVLGLARALQEMNPDWRTKLKRAGFLTRDAREVERKKYGLVKARKRFQYSKR
ncbi:MAG: 30S ribosomal protein S9 [candidate division Zixibacteria bacterium]|nr:30S ribosomal protein S9 [candidate division Zixibacteria bacterium]